MYKVTVKEETSYDNLEFLIPTITEVMEFIEKVFAYSRTAVTVNVEKVEKEGESNGDNN